MVVVSECHSGGTARQLTPQPALLWRLLPKKLLATLLRALVVRDRAARARARDQAQGF